MDKCEKQRLVKKSRLENDTYGIVLYKVLKHAKQKYI